MQEKSIDISIVIVNYNVAYFLEQCLLSVEKAVKGKSIEVFVVDNNSVDESVEMVQQKFPWVKLIANKQNLGFSKANNQAIKESLGKYTLLLNPDTVLAENTLDVCYNFMESHEKAGGLGVKMVDGKGRFLPESKRGLPTPKVAFHKIFGLSKLFPKSKRFSQYHLGHLANDKTHKIDVLSGAFMFMRKSVLDKIGLLDESFFMYGEDIDLSYRIVQGGFDNYYLPQTQIIHYKGESTKKGSLNYVFIFYRAMVLFYKKHFSAQNARWFEILINLAIYLRAALSISKRFINATLLPSIDILVSATSFYFLTQWYKENSGVVLKNNLVLNGAIGTLFFLLIFGYILGAYDKKQTLFKPLKTAIYTTLATLICYALLPESIRFSRFLILSWGLSLLGILPLVRLVLNMITPGILKPQIKSKRILIVASNENFVKIKQQLEGSFEKKPQFFNLSHKQENLFNSAYLNDFARINKINEIIFSGENLSSESIMNLMIQLDNRDVDFKIAPPESLYIIGSSSVHTQGDVYTLKANSISTTENKRFKRTFDLVVSVLLISLFPITLLLKKGLVKSAFNVLWGHKTWVGFTESYHQALQKAPIKPAIFSIGILKLHKQFEQSFEWYTNNYTWQTDLKALYKAISQSNSAK